MNGLHGQVAVQHVDQARNLELFNSEHNMEAKYVLDYHRETVTPSPVQVSAIKILYLVLNIQITSHSLIANP